MSEPLILRVARWAREIPDAPAYTFLDYADSPGGTRRTLSWAGADLRARALAVRLREVARPGERAAILAPQGLEYVVAMLGAMYARVIAVPLFAPDLPGHADRLVRAYADADPVCVLTTTSALASVETFIDGRPAPRPKAIVTLDTVSDLLADEWEPEPIGLGDLAYLQYTSGSTRAPAGVEIGHGNVTANAEQLWTAFRATPRTSTAALWLPLFHDMGLIATIAAPIVGGNHAVFMDPVAFVMHPVRWLRMLSEYDDVFTGGPNFAYEYTASRVTEAEKATLDLSGVAVMLNGAEPLRGSTINRFSEAFAACGLRPEAHTPGYGLAEATVFVTAMDRDLPARVTVFDRDELTAGRAVPVAEPYGGRVSELVSCGVPTGQDVVVAGEDGTARPDGEVGEIWVRGPNVARAYWRDAERTAETFGNVLEGAQGSWLRTGDLGVIHGGELYITGRIKDLIIVDGRNHYPQDVEVTVQEADDAVRRDHVAAFAEPGEETERLVVVAERSRRAEGRDPAEVEARVRAAVAKNHDLRLHAFLLVEAGAVPRTSSGKIARRACAQAYLDGVFSAGSAEGAGA
ncbi:fatty acyl-AMP ligase [Planomonospora venezuelensis]|uniref:Fatty acid CoA ligase FadD32 n=1 Tax=Planomonospora venezuelensis TaxID=1999 RepID=A0A841D789_PLAVE|nr:fatty acyl-AMP ligase [Planomonospora venezuelensis]MBB5965339.1 fatty acid CoA ligase FadD32 [Planomonospora venezuelensis]GIN00473.1 fatty-acid--CoA ligase [Planomonospora venezuelensis]